MTVVVRPVCRSKGGYRVAKMSRRCAVNDGNVDDDHPLVQAAITLSKKLAPNMANGIGSFGQNRMFACRKPA